MQLLHLLNRLTCLSLFTLISFTFTLDFWNFWDLTSQKHRGVTLVTLYHNTLCHYHDIEIKSNKLILLNFITTTNNLIILSTVYVECVDACVTVEGVHACVDAAQGIQNAY